jgi:hypothetical protein
MHGDIGSLVEDWSRRRGGREKFQKLLILMALPRGLEPLFSP